VLDSYLQEALIKLLILWVCSTLDACSYMNKTNVRNLSQNRRKYENKNIPMKLGGSEK
jgi:hypothetical protein